MAKKENILAMLAIVVVGIWKIIMDNGNEIIDQQRRAASMAVDLDLDLGVEVVDMVVKVLKLWHKRTTFEQEREQGVVRKVAEYSETNVLEELQKSAIKGMMNHGLPQSQKLLQLK